MKYFKVKTPNGEVHNFHSDGMVREFDGEFIYAVMFVRESPPSSRWFYPDSLVWTRDTEYDPWILTYNGREHDTTPDVPDEFIALLFENALYGKVRLYGNG